MAWKECYLICIYFRIHLKVWINLIQTSTHWVKHAAAAANFANAHLSLERMEWAVFSSQWHEKKRFNCHTHRNFLLVLHLFLFMHCAAPKRTLECAGQKNNKKQFPFLGVGFFWHIVKTRVADPSYFDVNPDLDPGIHIKE